MNDDDNDIKEKYEYGEGAYILSSAGIPRMSSTAESFRKSVDYLRSDPFTKACNEANGISDGPLYFESHVTIEPVFEEKLEHFSDLCKKHKFQPAKLLLQKRKEDTPERSSKDSFCTGHGTNQKDLEQRMNNLVQDLKENNFKVWRKKIEAVLIDEKYSKE